MSQLFATPPKLTERQAWVYHELRTGQLAAPLETGAMLHRWQGCRFCTDEVPCDYAESAGREVLEALRKKGLLRRDRHWRYRRTDQPTAQSRELPPDF